MPFCSSKFRWAFCAILACIVAAGGASRRMTFAFECIFLGYTDCCPCRDFVPPVAPSANAAALMHDHQKVGLGDYTPPAAPVAYDVIGVTLAQESGASLHAHRSLSIEPPSLQEWLVRLQV